MQTHNSAYSPFEPARRPGASPSVAPNYRVIVHRQFASHWSQLVQRVGLQGAQQFWDHVASSPGSGSGIASTVILKGRAGRPNGPGWSRTYHYEVSSMGRIDYQFHNSFKTTPEGDEHKVVAILTINYSSH